MFPAFGGIGPYGSYGNLGIYGALVAYGSESLTETSPRQIFNEPLTVAQVKAYLHLPERSPVDPEEEDLLAGMIMAAREQAEILQGRDLVVKQFDRAHDYWPSYRIELRAPLVSVDRVEYKNSDGIVTVMTENDDYVVDCSKQPGIIVPPYNATWPVFACWPSSAILIRFKSGYSPDSAFWSDAGARIRIGMRLLISAWFNGRLPFEKGVDATSEYPYAVTSCLSYGSMVRAR
jgi:uncharacterized phiE125 gp8 family phage protein